MIASVELSLASTMAVVIIGTVSPSASNDRRAFGRSTATLSGDTCPGRSYRQINALDTQLRCKFSQFGVT